MFLVLKGLKHIYFMFLEGELKNHMKNFKKSTGKILLASGLVVSMSACSVTSLFGEKEKQMLNLVNKKVKKLRQKVNHLKQRKNQLTQKKKVKMLR